MLKRTELLQTHLHLQAVRRLEREHVPRLRPRRADHVQPRLPAPEKPPFFGRLGALRAHAEAPYKIYLLWETKRAPNRRGRARTVWGAAALRGLVLRGLEADSRQTSTPGAS